MTAPVTQEADSEKIAMTAPVTQEPGPTGWRVAFLLPSSYTWETAPEPTDQLVTLRRVSARRMAAVRFSGTWAASRFEAHEHKLRSFIARHGLRIAGPPEYARYNPPFTPWFLRRNEVLIPVEPVAHVENLEREVVHVFIHRDRVGSEQVHHGVAGRRSFG